MNRLISTATTSDERKRDAKVAVLPIGSFEQHGDHLPLITDTVIACAISRELANNYPVLLLPPITISCSHEHASWPGTASISARTLYSVVEDIYYSVTRSGPSALVVVNGHGGNYVLSNIVQEGNVEGRKMALFPSKDDWNDARSSAQLTTSSHEDMHAGELETSILLYTYPELVGDSYRAADWTVDDRRHLLTIGMQGYSRSGVMGRPSLGTSEKGKAMLDSFVDDFAATLQLFVGS